MTAGASLWPLLFVGWRYSRPSFEARVARRGPADARTSEADRKSEPVRQALSSLRARYRIGSPIRYQAKQSSLSSLSKRLDCFLIKKTGSLRRNNPRRRGLSLLAMTNSGEGVDFLAAFSVRLSGRRCASCSRHHEVLAYRGCARSSWRALKGDGITMMRLTQS